MEKTEGFTVNDYLDKLNDVQREAVINYKIPSLIIAGAGSGKTRVLTNRIAYMLDQGVASYSILALTFTNKAAREMRERISQLVSPQLTRNLWMGTFHSIFARILRSEAEHLGYPSSYTIYDTSDAKNVVKMIIKELNLNDETYVPGEILSRISLAKNNLVTPQAYEANSIYLTEDRERRRPQFSEIYKLYTRRCKENGAMDFDDLLLNINILFKDFPEVLSKYQKQFRYILVDEYQDTNYAQYIIVRRLAAEHSNVCVVGDDAQSIYSFRGAKIENILSFQKDFPNARLFKLEQNYRSTQTIVDAANSIIEKNRRQIRKKSFSKGERGDLIKVIKAYTDKEEASVISSEIYNTVREKGALYSDMAILYRTNAQSRVLEESLRSRNIPYKIYGGMSFYQRKEIKNLLGYVRLVVNPKDDEAFLRIINTPARGIGDVTIAKISAAAAKHGISMWEAVSTLDMNDMELRGGAGKKIMDFVSMIKELSAMRGMTDAYDLGLAIATRSGIIGSYKMQNTPEAMSALENIEELLNSIRAYGEEQQKLSDELGEDVTVSISIEEWLQNIALLTDMDTDTEDDANRVTMMTVHSAKGLEFDYVYIAGLEENLFPSLMSMGTPEGLEEERRLFYVALTRAKRGAVLTFAESRFKWGSMTFSQPSRFLKEISPEYLELHCDLGDDDSSDNRDAASNISDCFARQRSGYGYNRGHNGQGGSYGPGSYGENGKPVYMKRQGGDTYGSPANRPNRVSSGIGGNNQSVNRVNLGGNYRRISSGEVSSNVESVANLKPEVNNEGYNSSACVDSDYAVGMSVEHSKFGIGIISALEDFNGDVKITVDFNAAGRKTLLKRFAKLVILKR